MPDLRLGRADEYFHSLRERVWANPALPVWDGELYLEYHRGVYTTHGWLKRLHRRNEERLLLAESLDAQRWALATSAGAEAPDARTTLDDAWRALLLHEFHDILPGSSIGPVYDDAKRDLTALADRLDAFSEQAARDVVRLAGAPDGAWLIHNPSPCSTPGATALVTMPLGDALAPTLAAANNILLPAQEVISVTGERALLIETPMLAGRGCLLAYPTTDGSDSQGHESDAPTASQTADGGAILENAHIRVTLNAQGAITSLLDRRLVGGRELILPGAPANVITAFDDRPRKFDAWDIDAGYERKPYDMDSAQITGIEAGPLRATVRVSAHCSAAPSPKTSRSMAATHA